MIHIDRNKVDPPTILIDPNAGGSKEIKDAIHFFSIVENLDKSFAFKVYRHASVKSSIDQLFNFKCAYCESYYGATQPVDVEHYRPKSAVLVNGKQKKPGYYWLAADWDNLLPCCIDCNRKRTQNIPGQPSQVLGKKDEFPIVDETKRAAAPGQESLEQRLLINPCKDNPDEHLEFVVEPGTDDVTVRAAILPGGQPSPMGQESIRVYALQRSGLAQARRNRMKLVKATVKRINQLIEMFNEDPDDADLEDWLNQEMEELNRLQSEDQPYAGMARQYIKKFFN